MNTLAGKVAIVTGGTLGVGRGVAAELGAAGARVFITDCGGEHVPRKLGLIVNISTWAAQKHIGNVAYGVSKAATDKMTADMAAELRPHGVTVVSLYPGMVRTEKVMQAAAWLDLSNSESPEFIGRAIVAIARDPEVMRYSGTVLIAGGPRYISMVDPPLTGRAFRVHFTGSARCTRASRRVFPVMDAPVDSRSAKGGHAGRGERSRATSGL